MHSRIAAYKHMDPEENTLEYKHMDPNKSLLNLTHITLKGFLARRFGQRSKSEMEEVRTTLFVQILIWMF